MHFGNRKDVDMNKGLVPKTVYFLILLLYVYPLINNNNNYGVIQIQLSPMQELLQIIFRHI